MIRRSMNRCSRLLTRIAGRCLSIGLMLPLFLWTLGCEDLPTTRVGKFQPAVAESVAETGRGGYVWKLNSFEFEVNRPPTLTFMQDIDWTKLVGKLDISKFEESSESVKPPGVDDDVYAWLRRFIEALPEPITKFKLGKGEQFSGTVFSLNRKGDRLLTLGRKLHLWNVDDGQLLKSFDPPLSDCKFVSFVAGDKSVLLHDNTQLLKISLEDGRTTATWNPKSGGMTQLRVASRKPLFAVVDNSRQLWMLDENLKERKRYQGPDLANDHIAIHPEGHSVLAVTDSGMVRWKSAEDEFVSDEFAVFEGHEFLPDLIYPLAGIHFNRWMSNTTAYEFWQDRPTVTISSNPTSPQYLLPMVHFAEAVTDESSSDWIVIVASKKNEKGEDEVAVQDLSLRYQEFSVPMPLGTRVPELAQANESASRLCFVYENSLEVIERLAWVDFTGTFTLAAVADLIAQGRIPQFEVCAKLLKERQVHRNERSGERIYSVIISFAADVIQQVARDPSKRSIDKMVDTWYRQGSELALLCSVQRELNAARSGNVSDESLNRAKRDLAKVMEQPNPPAIAFSFLFDIASMQGENPADYQDRILQYIELYPLEAQGHSDICMWLLPSAAGVEGEAHTYLSALVDAMPAAIRNVMYGKTAIWMAQQMDTRGFFQKTGFDAARLTAATDDIIASGKFSGPEVELLIEIALFSKDDEAIKKLTEHYYRKFCMPSLRGYRGLAATKIFETRSEILSQTHK